MPDDNRRLVFSSENGWQVPEPKRQPKPQQRAHVPDDGVLRIARERRRGSMVSIVTGLGERELADVAKALKRLCGSGGTAKNGVVEIQGDHRDTIVAFFEGQGRRVKKAGG
ncbi:MAG: stress response translation initiation inhibitor YciH [Vulcanimicrobiaceae bacterium]